MLLFIGLQTFYIIYELLILVHNPPLNLESILFLS